MGFVLILAAVLWGIGHLMKVPMRGRLRMLGALYLAVIAVQLLLPEGHPLRELTGGSVALWLLLGAAVALVLGYRALLVRLRGRAEGIEAARAQGGEAPSGPFSDVELERYARHITLPDIGGAGQLRGMMKEELTIKGPAIDLHSGMFGGIAMNPIRVLSDVLSALHDDNGRVTVPGFYDGVPEISDALRDSWEALNFDAEAFLGAVGLSHPAGEKDRTALEMIWSRPTAEVNGIWGGYTGAGFKTVLPSEAHAKISFRLVAGQDPARLHESFVDWVQAQMPEDCTVSFAPAVGSAASQMDTSHPIFEMTRQALSAEWPEEAAYIGCGGSIPVAGHFKEILGMDSVLAGFGKDDDAIHSPNEKYDVESFHRGIRSWARVLGGLTQV